MTYTIPYDSAIGQKLTDYFAQCEICNDATAQFIQSLGTEHPSLGFPTLTPEQLSKVSCQYAESCDAGGFVAIVMPAEIANQLTIDSDIWVKVAQQGDDNVIFCPRFTIAEHNWMRYNKAMQLLSRASDNPCYRFDIDTDPRSNYYQMPRMYRYGNVKHGILPANLRLIEKESRGPVTDLTRLAFVTRFDLRRDYDPSAPQGVSNKPFVPQSRLSSTLARGRELYNLIEALPTVPANEMLKILQLRMPADAKRGFHPVFEYKADDKLNQYVIDTNLVSPIISNYQL